MTVNEENTKRILSCLATNGIDYTLRFDIDDTDEANIQAQIQIDLQIDGLPDFAFFYNAKTDDVIQYSIVLTMDENVLEAHFSDWENEFKSNDVFSDLIKAEDNTVHFYGEVSQKGFTDEMLSKIIAELKNPSPFIKRMIAFSKSKSRRI